MKQKHLTIFTLLITFFSYSQTLSGRFEGAVTREGSVQLINFDFYQENGIQKGTYEIPEAGLFDVPIEEVNFINNTLHIKFYYGNFQCLFNQKNEQITGISEKWNPKIRLHVKKTFTKEKPYIIEKIVFNNKDAKLSGMIYLPIKNTKKPLKYVILVHGSGAQDRFSPYYISLGYSLSKRGFGVLLYDKRGTGLSSGNFENASMIDLAGDAVAAFNYLKSHKKNVSEIGFLGTSQGGWIAPIASKKVNCDFMILNVGPAVSVYQQDVNRVEHSMKADGWNQKEIDAAVTYTKLYFQFVKDNNPSTWTKLKKSSLDIAKNNWAEYINIPQNKNDFTWWRNNNYNPEQTLKTMNCRTLSLFAEFDPLVAPEKNEKLMRNYLNEAGIKYSIKVIPETIHDMKTFQGLNGENWEWPNTFWEWRKEPVEFMNTITQFLRDIDYKYD